jgi:phage RecT family recombinase
MTETDTSQLRQELAERAAAPEAERVNDIVKRNRDAFIKLLGSEQAAAQFVAGWKTYMDRNPQLWECEPYSLAGGMAQAAQLGLSFGALGHVYLVPHKLKNGSRWATFVIGYTGMVKLARDAGATGLRATVIWDCDEYTQPWENEKGLHWSLAPGAVEDQKERVGVLVAWKDNGERVALHCPPSRIDAALEASAMRDKTRREDDWYWRKTGIRFARPWLPMTPALALALEADEQPAEPFDETPAEADDA